LTCVNGAGVKPPLPSLSRMLIPLESPQRPADPGRFALFDLGFRPFYLLAAVYAALAVPLWALDHAGVLPGPGIVWHAQEMIFGYAFAVVAGFLLTAVRNWTGRPTPTGAALAALAALWLAARALAFVSPPVAAWINALFALALAAAIGRPLLAVGNRRNYFFILVVLALGAAGLVVQAWPQRGLALGLDLVLFAIAVVAGRVVPQFTNNAIPQAHARRVPWLDRAALGMLLALLAADAAERIELAAVIAIIAAALHGARLALWSPHRTRGRPIVWILHVSYAWLVIHLALRGLTGFDLLPYALGTHALAVGGIGGMTLGMMTRTARGHTARPLVAGRAEIAAYALVQLAAVARVLVPLALPALLLPATFAAALLWCAAFTIFAAAYAPILSRPRLDGQPG
jgi:uncharacterized protein involved in response to NO